MAASLIENITRTVYSAFLQTCLLTKLPFRRVPNTTLNEKFGILADDPPPSDQYPSARYLTVGIGGHTWVVGQNGKGKVTPMQHKATDAALFEHLPFVVREPTNDLTAAQRQNYALRRETTYKGRRYVEYYLKRIDYTGVTPEMNYTVVVDGVPDTKPFVPTSANLNPTPQPLAPTGVNIPSGDYVSASARIAIPLDVFDITELRNAAKIIYDDEELAQISEIGICSGIDKPVQVTGTGNTTFSFMDAICVQVLSHVMCYYSLAFINDRIDIDLNIGAVEPLFKLEDAPTP